MNIGFIGLGRMGAGMAGNLLKAGHHVAVYNRTPSRAHSLIAQGAQAAASVSEACRGDAVVTMLANDQAVEEVVCGPDGVIASMKVGTVHVSCSTISIALSRRLDDAHADARQHFVAAPVFGRPDAAAAGTLFVVTAGNPEAVAMVMPVLQAVGQRTFVIADVPEAANLVKLSGNFLIASVIEALGEALALISKGGVDQHQYIELLTSTLFGAPVYKTYGNMIAGGKFEPAGFAAPLGHKDIQLALAAAEELRVPLPLANLLHDRFLTLFAYGGERLDWSAIGELAALDAGILAA
jgi:3-hydroxyisobutyrate dehydrogenase-like beta-hydroxyacid dehydrogenase